MRKLFEAPTVEQTAETLLHIPEARDQIEKTVQLLLRLAEMSEDEVQHLLADQS